MAIYDLSAETYGLERITGAKSYLWFKGHEIEFRPIDTEIYYEKIDPRYYDAMAETLSEFWDESHSWQFTAQNEPHFVVAAYRWLQDHTLGAIGMADFLRAYRVASESLKCVPKINMRKELSRRAGAKVAILLGWVRTKERSEDCSIVSLEPAYPSLAEMLENTRKRDPKPGQFIGLRAIQREFYHEQ